MAHKFDSRLRFATQADPAEVATALRREGCCLIESAVNARVVHRCHDEFLSFFGALPPDRQERAQREPDMARIWTAHRSVGEVTEPEKLVALARRLAVSAALRAIARQYFEAPAVMIHGLINLRFYQPSERANYVGFHQDIDVLPPQGLTVWVPLQAVGNDAPSLELIPDPLSQDAGLRVKPQFMIDAADAARNADLARDESKVWAPVMAPGDMLLFSPYMRHRTQNLPQGEQRRSVDLRLLPINNVGETYQNAAKSPIDSGMRRVFDALLGVRAGA